MACIQLPGALDLKLTSTCHVKFLRNQISSLFLLECLYFWGGKMGKWIINVIPIDHHKNTMKHAGHILSYPSYRWGNNWAPKWEERGSKDSLHLPSGVRCSRLLAPPNTLSLGADDMYPLAGWVGKVGLGLTTNICKEVLLFYLSSSYCLSSGLPESQAKW